MFGKISKYFSEVSTELSKVSWPTREEVYGSVAVVLFLCVLLSVIVFGADFILNRMLRIIF
ncbi:preprotein translocase subunit SecE [candidate division KSB1 bacterium]|nr:MAG: preprotein translocase subunit SecE [candidate division KSB1 bacterium]